jgi:HEAT repeat protein
VFLIVIISIGLIIQKIRTGISVQRKRTLSDKAQQALTQYLLTEADRSAGSNPEVVYSQMLEQMTQAFFQKPLQQSSIERSHRRNELYKVMLGYSANLSGETLARLVYAFHALKFVDEELRLARSKKWWIRARACYRLRFMHASGASAVLSENLDDENEDVKIEAAQSLLEIEGLDALSPILLTIKDISRWMQIRLSHSIFSFGGDAVPHLVKGLQSTYHPVQKFCIEMLGWLGDISAVPTIIEYMHYNIADVQLASLKAFGRIGDERAIPVVLDFMKTTDENTRIAAVNALGNLGSPSTVSALHDLLLNDTVTVRLAAAEALSKIGDAGIEILQRATQSHNELARLVALQYLHEHTIAHQGKAS